MIYPTHEQLKDIKMIVCDLDGTLYDKEKHVSQKTINFLIELQKKGYILILATGRFYYELQDLILKLQLEKYHGFVICANGVEIYDISKHTCIHSFKYLNYDEVSKMIELAKRNHIITYCNYHNQYHVMTTPLMINVARLLKWILYPLYKLSNNRLINGLYQLSFQPQIDYINKIHKICFLSFPHQLNQWIHIVHSWNQPYVFYPVSDKVTEMVHESVSKYHAVLYITQLLNISMSQVLAFGDSGNDIELLEKVGIGIAMKNGLNEVLEKTKYHTSLTNDEDGVYHYLKEYFHV